MYLLLKKWLSQKTTRAAIVLAICTIIGFICGTVQLQEMVDKVVAVIISFVTLYLASNIGEKGGE